MDIVISGSGVHTPAHQLSNKELVDSYNQYAKNFNESHAAQIQSKRLEAMELSDEAFIEKCSGIKSRYVIEKQGVLNPNIMHPIMEERTDESVSFQAEFACFAAQKAMNKAQKAPKDIDAVLCACSNMQRPYPAMAIEVQKALGIKGFAFDMNVACSSASFAIANAYSMVHAGLARAVLVVNPEICSAHANYKDRESHFIFGDVATAVIVEKSATVSSSSAFVIKDLSLSTEFSSNVRNNGGFMNRLSPGCEQLADKLFYQQGRKVFKEVTLGVIDLLSKQLLKTNREISEFKRMWLHQANSHMNRLIVEKLTGHALDEEFAPIILDEYGNTAGAGSIIAFNQFQDDMLSQDLGLLCSFGAGYSIGSIILEKL